MNVEKPRVSVLMTIYNAGPYLQASLDSVMSQTFPDWELIAVENGSTDGSPTVLAAYPDPRVKVFSLPSNIGRTPALRLAFEKARGEYIAVLDADDVAYPGRLTRQVEFLDAHREVVLVASWAEHIDEQGRVSGRSTPPVETAALRDLMGRINPVVHSSVMYRREEAERAGGYPVSFVFAQDFALILALAQGGTIAMIGDYLCQLRVFPGSMTRSSRYYSDFLREELTLLERAGRLLPLSAHGRVINALKVLKCRVWYGAFLFLRNRGLSGVKVK